jgi:hypothetical protein
MTVPTLNSNVRSNTFSITVIISTTKLWPSVVLRSDLAQVESQCSQFQDRFKRTGQFWTRPGLRNLLALGVMIQNNTFAYLWN